MGNLSEHFSRHEFRCACGCGGDDKIDKSLIAKLENLHNLLSAYQIIITSGFRCPKYSPTVGGYTTDAHTKGIAADIVVYKTPSEKYDSATVAEASERVGFSGIGIIDDTAVHVDVRNLSNYFNSHWFGDERTGDDFIKTFDRGTVFTPRKKTVSISVVIDEHKYSGLITEE